MVTFNAAFRPFSYEVVVCVFESVRVRVPLEQL